VKNAETSFRRVSAVDVAIYAKAHGIRVAEARKILEGYKCVTQTNPDGRGDGDCEDNECRARMPHDRFHRYST
jgi:hypothetical protein